MAHSTAEDTEHIIEAAFNKAFSPPSSRRQSMQPPSKVFEETKSSSPPPHPSSTESSSSLQDSWKLEYEDQVKAWRTQSAEAREKAEKVREEWEERRAAERESEEFAREPQVSIPGPGYTPQAFQAENKNEEVTADVKLRETVVVDLVPGGLTAHATASSINSTLARMGSQQDTNDGSQRWEEITSPTSSYPSVSFPEQSTTPPLHPHPTPQAPPQSVTLSVFDHSLSTRTRLKALTSSLAINLFLPFVNGVMLGFGEIFAKNFILGWLGWGSTATSVGVNQRQRFGQPGQPGFR